MIKLISYYKEDLNATANQGHFYLSLSFMQKNRTNSILLSNYIC